MKRIAIINPASGNGKTGRMIPTLKKTIGPLVREIVVTGSSSHCRETAQNAGSYDEIIAIGGDGTIFDIMHGLTFDRCVLGVIPSGTGNSLARDLAVPTIMRGVRAIAQGQRRTIDLMQARLKSNDGSERVVVSASTIAFGYVVNCTKAIERSVKSLGKAAYIAASLISTLQCKRVDYDLQNNHASPYHRRLTGLIISNTRYSANFLTFPNASPDDGTFDIMELDAGCAGQIAHNLSVLTKRYFYQPSSMSTSTHFSVRPSTPQDLLVDGELFSGITELTVTILPHLLTCIAAS